MDKGTILLAETIRKSQIDHPDWLLQRSIEEQIINDCRKYDDIIEFVECKSFDISVDENGNCIVTFLSPFDFQLSEENDASFFDSISKMKSVSFHLVFDRYEDEEGVDDNFPYMGFQFTYPRLFAINQ